MRCIALGCIVLHDIGLRSTVLRYLMGYYCSMHCFLLIGLAPLQYYTLTRSSLRVPRELRPISGFRVLLCCVDVPLLAFHIFSPVFSSSGKKQGRNQCAASPNLVYQQSLDHNLTSCYPIAIRNRWRVIRLYDGPDATSNTGN